MSKRKKAGGRKRLNEAHPEVQVEIVNDEYTETDNEILTEAFPEKRIMYEADENIPGEEAAEKEEQANPEVEFAVFAESVSGDNSSGRKCGNLLCQWRQWLPGLILIILAVVYFLSNGSKNVGTSLPQETENATIESEFVTVVTARTVQVIGTSETDGVDISAAGAGDAMTEENQGGTDNQDGIASGTENASGIIEWQKTIFGEAESAVLSSIKVSGLTEEQKECSVMFKEKRRAVLKLDTILLNEKRI